MCLVKNDYYVDMQKVNDLNFVQAQCLNKLKFKTEAINKKIY